jgi:hypothetical protein
MATRKPSTALFEVIHSGQRSGSSGALRTPLWWFKSKFQGSSVERTAGAPSATPAAATKASSVTASSNNDRPLGRSAVHLSLDREHQEITLRLRYTTATVAVFAILVTIGLAYAVGRHIAGGPSPAYAAATTDELRQLPPTPGAMDIAPRLSAASTLQSPALSVAPLRDSDTAAPLPLSNGIDSNQARSIGLNYILVQSYPNEKLASEARNFLVKSGVPCTVEKGPKDWASDPSWCSVITTAGYAHIHSPEYESAARNITTLGEQFAGKARFKRFEPHAYKWKQASVS